MAWRKRRTLTLTVAISLGALLASASAHAQSLNGQFTGDENGHGVLTGFGPPIPYPGVLAPDPGPGGLPSVLTYFVPGIPLTNGDVLLQEGIGGPVLDVFRFNYDPIANVGSLVVYSDNLDRDAPPGDTSGPPGALYPNTVTLLEVGTEANNGALYHPLLGQPGDLSFLGVDMTYKLVSDVPEPGTLAMMIGGLGLTGAALYRRTRDRGAMS